MPALHCSGDPKTDPPCFFSKPSDAACQISVLPYPPLTQNLHHEIEQVVAIGKGGSNISEAEALSHVWGYGVGVDLTRRDIQAEAKEKRKPWDMAKGFDFSAPMSVLVPRYGTASPQAPSLSLPTTDPFQTIILGRRIDRLTATFFLVRRSRVLPFAVTRWQTHSRGRSD